ncbi:hypothetical protein FVQ98_00210 [Ottowia sp. GY511]|uniref:DUF4347 domain-containing protein n=1 Tax=Ottowia flava TaxID=2675430 RepID=A0ABW4KSY3_9BURK|nr:hypothetical protein [Ottowia sp. GY511]TXK33345.1 hypothetical protein FVQ98_00210 [Ottowia sp. GY511]
MSHPAAADVLFVDTNNAPPEIQAVQRTLAPGEKLWIIPSYARLPQAQRERASRASTENERLTKLALDCATDEPGTNAAACDAVGDGLRQSELDRVAALEGYVGDTLLNELNDLVTDGRRWHSVVVSGHHENGFFAGELVSLSRQQMHQLLSVSLNQTDAAPNLYLLGCDTLTPRALNEVLLPAMQTRGDVLIVGAEDKAPTKYEPRNIAFVERAFKRAPGLRQVSTVDQLQREQHVLRANNWPVALWLDGQYVALHGHQRIAVPLSAPSALPAVVGESTATLALPSAEPTTENAASPR